MELIDGIDKDKVDARDLSAAQVRQLLAFGNERIQAVLESKWGVLHETPQAKLETIDRWKNELKGPTLAQGNLENGSMLFKKSCANCHKLYGEGQSIGPDLTGTNRRSTKTIYDVDHRPQGRPRDHRGHCWTNGKCDHSPNGQRAAYDCDRGHRTVSQFGEILNAGRDAGCDDGRSSSRLVCVHDASPIGRD